ncbi:hypothetical protein GFS31_41480 (plasmid) [Leptolyngbya sp. BL0902]|uniref:hypothetical protein n=1 Tax=Leptolyngbya sp. BL0902 TaxID=1115757 RepID=UPI0018E8680A|nr:hypothetical protein [Leptolyngbya sp. BL0902]QQE67435.1 hypothetical protein GFS31_41480 [Leptolyngbya sp. BL0902]
MEFKPYGNLDIARVKRPSLHGCPPTVSAIVLTRGAADALAQVMRDWPDAWHQRWQEALLDLVYDCPFNVWAKRVEVEHPELAPAVDVLNDYRLPTLGLVFDAAELSLMQQITEALRSA